MSEGVQKQRGRVLALVAASIALVTVVVNFIHSGKIAWGGVVILLLAVVVWQGTGRNTDGG